MLGCVLHWPDLPSLCHGPWKPAPCKPVGLCPSLTSKGILCYQKYYLIWPRLRVPKESKYQRKIKTIFGQSFLGHSCFPRPRSPTRLPRALVYSFVISQFARFTPLLVGSQCSRRAPASCAYNLLRSLFRTAWFSLGVILHSHDMHDLGSQRAGWFSPPPALRPWVFARHSPRKEFVLPKILLNLSQTSSTLGVEVPEKN